MKLLQQAITYSLETNEKLENLSKEIDVIKNYQMEIIDRKKYIIRIKNVPNGLDSGLEMSESRISEQISRIYSVWTTEKIDRKKLQLFRDLGDSNKRSNVCIVRLPGSEKECEAEQLVEEKVTENFPNFSKDIYLQIQESEQTSKGKPKEIYTKTYHQ